MAKNTSVSNFPKNKIDSSMPLQAPEAAREESPSDDTHVEIVAQLAYEKFLARGEEHGHDVEDWLAAEREVSERRGEKPN